MWEVALVQCLGFNLPSVSQLLDDGNEVHFKKGCSRVLDSKEKLICKILPFGRIFRVDFSLFSGPSRCLVGASPSSSISSSELWKWHRRLGHLSFDVLVRLSSMGLSEDCPSSSWRRT